MAYRVIERFFDGEDWNHYYDIGDTYPREGVQPSDERIKMLSTDLNPHNKPFITQEGGGSDGGSSICDDRGHSDSDKRSDSSGAAESFEPAADSKRKTKDNSKQARR